MRKEAQKSPEQPLRAFLSDDYGNVPDCGLPDSDPEGPRYERAVPDPCRCCCRSGRADRHRFWLRSDRGGVRSVLRHVAVANLRPDSQAWADAFPIVTGRRGCDRA